MVSFFITIKREITIALRRKIDYLNPLGFFLLIILLFPLAITSDIKMLALIGPGVIWIGLLFANLLSVENLFSVDFEDGTLEQMWLNSNSFILVILGKLIVYWILTAFPLIGISVLAGILYELNIKIIYLLLSSLLLGSPVLVLLSALGSALTLGLRNRGLVLILLVIPLFIPILIFGAGAVNHAAQAMAFESQLYFLGALLILALTFLPLAITSALKISLE